jgi:hypothetical protein
MTTAALQGERNCLWLFAAVLALGVGLRVWLYAGTGFTVGDAFITFRFAEEFAAGNGLVFNPGEWVGGNTSVLHAFLLGLGTSTGLAVPTVARIEGILFDVGALFLIWSIFRGQNGIRSPQLQAVALAFIFLCPLLFWYSISGLETSLYLLLIFFILDRTLKKLDWIWCLAVALVFFCRPDGIIVVTAALAYTLAATRRFPWRAVGATFLLGLVYLGFNFFVYHSLIPRTVIVKGTVYQNMVGGGFSFVAGRFFFHRGWLFACYLGLLALLIVLRRNRPQAVLLGFATVGYLIFILCSPNPRTWYAAPFLTLSLCVIIFSLITIAEEMECPFLTPAACGALAIYLLASCFAYQQLYQECGHWMKRLHDLRQAEGIWIRDNTPPEAKTLVESLEIGYFSKRYTLDWPGLVAPQVFAMVKAHPDMGMLQIADRLKLDYVVIHDNWFKEDQTDIPPNYVKIKTFQTNEAAPIMGFEGGTDFIYQRMDPGAKSAP